MIFILVIIFNSGQEDIYVGRQQAHNKGDKKIEAGIEDNSLIPFDSNPEQEVNLFEQNNLIGTSIPQIRL